MRIGRSARFVWFALVVLALSAALFAQVSIAIRIGPPPLPVYVQPACPAEGYIWTPGYWAYDYHDGDYYWVPGTWVMPPQVGFLWTPGYWGWVSDRFVFHEGYWGPRVGFYGGINYGFGYFGSGYEGGRWDHDRFFYNRAVSNVNVTNIHNVYNTTVINNITVNHVSYNGGRDGINARPTPEQESAERERHIPQVAAQVEHVQAARANNELRASVNHGQPRVAATPRPGAFEDREVVSAREASPTNRGEAEPRSSGPGRPANYVPRPGSAVHPNDLPPRERPAFPNTGSTELDKKYLQQQEKLLAKQDQERQRLQQKQDQEHQKLARQNADETRQQQLEQRHQQQTQELQQRHSQQQQHLQQKQQAVSRSRA